MIRFRFKEKVKTTDNRFDCSIYKGYSNDETFFCLKLFPNVEFIEDEMIDHSALIHEFSQTLLDSVQEKYKQHGFIHVSYSWRNTKTAEVGKVGNLYFFENKSLLNKNLYALGIDIKKQRLIGTNQTLHPLFKPLIDCMFNKFCVSIIFDEEIIKEKLIYKRKTGNHSYLFNDSVGRQYLYGDSTSVSFLTKKEKENFSGIQFFETKDGTGFRFSIYQNGLIHNLKGLASSWSVFYDSYMNAYSSWIHPLTKKEVRWNKRLLYSNELSILLSISYSENLGIDMCKILTSEKIEEVPNIPGVATKGYEDDFIKLKLIENFDLLGNAWAFEFLFDIEHCIETVSKIKGEYSY